MRLLVEPICGWGWSDLQGRSIQVPEPFELDVAVLEMTPFTAVGRLDDCFDHPLRGLRVLLSQRHAIQDGHYNLVASDVEQGSAKPDTSAAVKIRGFATARQIQ
jgi:hypothetical protein